MSQNTLKLDYHELVLRHKALTRLQQTFTPSQRHYIISVLVSLFTVAKHLLHRQSLDVYDMGVELSFAYMSSQLQKNAQPKSGFKIAEIVLASMLLVSKTIRPPPGIASTADQNTVTALCSQSTASGHQLIRRFNMNHAVQNRPLTMIAAKNAIAAGYRERRIFSCGTVETEHARQIKDDGFTEVLPGKFPGCLQSLGKR